MAATKQTPAQPQVAFPFSYNGDTPSKVTVTVSFDGERTDVLYLPDSLPIFGDSERPAKGRLVFIFDDSEMVPIREKVRQERTRPAKFGK